MLIKGWNVFAHSTFLDQLEELIDEVEVARRRDPENYLRRNAAKRLGAILKIGFEVLPQDPTRAEYRLGDTQGVTYRHWFRVKFFQQYRLFFRYSSRLKTILLVWVNDGATKRAFGSKTDAYTVFRRMLEAGRPPDDWDMLMADSEANTLRLRRVAAGRKSE